MVAVVAVVVVVKAVLVVVATDALVVITGAGRGVLDSCKLRYCTGLAPPHPGTNETRRI